jgi:hypothetical protein
MQIEGSDLNLGTLLPYTTHVESGKGNSLFFVKTAEEAAVL